MNEYEILGGLHKIIDDDTNLKMKEWLDWKSNQLCGEPGQDERE